ncbi:MAG TPA: hypothetical protein VMU80_05565, partial [Bryobacteraceae bacterium]|nr:hypothetical protein [Bryobacteraceae bacterium]
MERRAAVLEQFLARHQTWVLALWSLAYFAGTALRARGKPFWYDEILTLLEAHQPSLAASLHALGDVDWMPPATHFVFYFTYKLLGSGEMAFRIPSMIGFWLFCLCLFFFARRRVSFYFSFLALLLPFASTFPTYSCEARSYALMLGLCGLALVSWQAATVKARRGWPLAGLALSLLAAIALQYWAVLIYLPLAGAEAYRNFQRRRIDWPIWIAFVLGGVPLLFSVFLLVHGLHAWLPWIRTQPTDYLFFYKFAFFVPSWFYFTNGAALLLLLWFVLGGSKEPPEGSCPSEVPAHEWLAAAVLLLIPVAGVSIALAAPPHMFTWRYAIPVIGGFALLVSLLAARFTNRRSALGLVLVLAALAAFADQMDQPRSFPNPFQAHGVKQQLERGPIVIDEDLLTYLQLWYYTPDRLKPHLLFLWLEPRVKFTLNGPFVTEFPKVGVPVLSYDSFALPGKEFQMYALK